MRRLAPLVLLIAGFGAGCGRTPSLMPLDQGRSWTYTFNAGSFQTFVEAVEVKGRVAVGSEQGAILTGPMGTSRLGWNGDTLLASRLANAGFSPPIPLAVESGGKAAKRKWHGTIEALGIPREAFATLSQTQERVAVGGVKSFTTRSELVIQARAEGREPTTIEVSTWFRPGVGIIRQEQRTNRKLIVALKLLD